MADPSSLLTSFAGPSVGPPSSLGGVALPAGASPATVATTNPFMAPSAGLDPNSIMNQAMPGLNQLKAANAGDKQGTNSTTFPVAGYTPPPGKDAPITFLADWYRYGNNTSTGDGSTLPRMVDDFSDEIASIYVYAYDSKSQTDKTFVPPYSKFILEAVTESHAERSQIVETFGDFYVFLFGERPPMYNFTGTLINSANANWVSDFKYYYDTYLRGTKCVENNARLVITYGGRQIEGFMLSMQTATDASLEKGVKLSFPVVVTRKSFIHFSKDFGFVTVGGVSTPDGKLKALLDQIAGKEGIGSSSPSQSAATNSAAAAIQQGKASETTNFA